MRTLYLKFILTAAAVALLGAGCGPRSTPTVLPSRSNAPLQPVAGTIITITNCKADPFILEAASGTMVTFKNNDTKDHTLTLASDDELKVKAGGTATYRTQIPEGFSNNFTLNYLCDGASSGAIFMP